jgi:hypothetical protein
LRFAAECNRNERAQRTAVVSEAPSLAIASAPHAGLAIRSPRRHRDPRETCTSIDPGQSAAAVAADNGAMLSRSVHWRFALLALVAAVLVVVMPTLAQLRVQPVHGWPVAAADAYHALHQGGATSDEARPHRIARARDGGHAAHDGACPYCPLLAGLLQWTAAASTSPRLDVARLSATHSREAPRSALLPGALGSRGPPVSRPA